MKILIVNDLLQGGGVERLMKDLVMEFRKRYEVAILTDKRDQDFDKIYPMDVTYYYQMEHEYPKGRNRIERKLIKLKRERVENALKIRIKEKRYDVLLCMKESWIMMMAITYGKEIPKRFAWVHTDYSQSYYTKDWFQTAEREVKYMQLFQNIICVSGVIADSIRKVIGDPGNLLVYYNPIDKQEILDKSEELSLDIERSERELFVTVGRLNLQKGYDILLEVCNLLNKEGYQYDVWIIGGGESWNNYQVLHDLEEQIRKYHLDNIYLLGPKKNPFKYVKQADWFLSSSRYEGYSYVSQEAAVLGKALLLTDCSGVRELLEDEANGIIMENSFAGIYQGMCEVLHNPVMKKQYAGKVTIHENDYYYKDRISKIEELFNGECCR